MPSRGDVIDRYRLLDLLGRGGMGTVYRAEHLGLGRQVALKLLDPAWLGSDGAKRFTREARTAARLDHPGCVRVLDHGHAHDGQAYLAMELLEGQTLDHWAKLRRPTPAAIAAVGVELCGALAYAHDAGVLHRDVKPANVMLARRGGGQRVVLIDFGLARLAEDPGITKKGVCPCSPSYVAPERLQGDAGDARSDLYAAGAVLWELIAGKAPFGDGDPVEIAARHLKLPVPSLVEARPDVPRALAMIIETAMAKDPAERFQTATEMLKALRAVAALPPPAPLPRAASMSY